MLEENPSQVRWYIRKQEVLNVDSILLGAWENNRLSGCDQNASLRTIKDKF